MSDFEYVFSFYSLILGLAAAEVMFGFADMWRDRRRMKVGISTPLVAVAILLGVMNAWITFWTRRETLEMGPLSMVMAALTALPYVFISRIMFPRAEQGDSLETHFAEHRWLLLAGLAAPVIVSRLWGLLEEKGYPGGFAGFYFAARMMLPLALIPIRNPRVNQIGLGVLVLILLAGLLR